MCSEGSVSSEQELRLMINQVQLHGASWCHMFMSDEWFLWSHGVLGGLLCLYQPHPVSFY